MAIVALGPASSGASLLLISMLRRFNGGVLERGLALSREWNLSYFSAAHSANLGCGLGRLYRRTGKAEQACEHFTIATTMYREMGMWFWLEHMEAETKDLA
jgi:hypothetical protein